MHLHINYIRGHRGHRPLVDTDLYPGMGGRKVRDKILLTKVTGCDYGPDSENTRCKESVKCVYLLNKDLCQTGELCSFLLSI